MSLLFICLVCYLLGVASSLDRVAVYLRMTPDERRALMRTFARWVW